MSNTMNFTKNGLKKSQPLGFSLVVFFFGWLALAFRGQYKAAIISLLTFNLAALFYYSFCANKLLARSLLEDNWLTSDNTDCLN